MGAATVHLPVAVQRGRRRSGPGPSPPAATAEGRTACALVNASADRAGPSAPPGRRANDHPGRPRSPIVRLDEHDGSNPGVGGVFGRVFRRRRESRGDVDDARSRAADGGKNRKRAPHARWTAPGGDRTVGVFGGFELAGTLFARRSGRTRQGGVGCPAARPSRRGPGPPSRGGFARPASEAALVSTRRPRDPDGFSSRRPCPPRPGDGSGEDARGECDGARTEGRPARHDGVPGTRDAPGS